MYFPHKTIAKPLKQFLNYNNMLHKNYYKAVLWIYNTFPDKVFVY